MRTRAPDAAVLRNVAALARFTDPRRLPPYPPWRRKRLLALAWRAYAIPAQRPWSEA